MNSNSERRRINKIVGIVEKKVVQKGKPVKTIDPVIKVTQHVYPYLSDKEIMDYSISALRIILKESDIDLLQTSLLAHISK